MIRLDQIVSVTGSLDNSLQLCYQKLVDRIKSYGRTIVAYSGGVDSTLVAKVARLQLGPDMLSVMSISPSFSHAEIGPALALLQEHGIPIRVIETDEISDPGYAANGPDRCYVCKTHLHAALFDIARQEGYQTVANGFNQDDQGDHRPGQQAGRERGVRSPLFEAGLTKTDVRSLARHLGLKNWNKPAMACLSSRVAYGTAINRDILARIDRAETLLRKLGFSDLRVRHHDTLARIEVPVDQIDQLMGQRETIISGIKDAGYIYVTLDLQGFRRGSGNEVLNHHG